MLCIVGFPIRISPDRRVLARSPKLFAGSYVLLRLLLPRHPSCALCSFKSPLWACSEYIRKHTLRSMIIDSNSSSRRRGHTAWRCALAYTTVRRHRFNYLPYPYTRFERTDSSPIIIADDELDSENQVENAY